MVSILSYYAEGLGFESRLFHLALLLCVKIMIFFASLTKPSIGYNKITEDGAPKARRTGLASERSERPHSPSSIRDGSIISMIQVIIFAIKVQVEK